MSSASTETARELRCVEVAMWTAWHWPWVMLTEGERMSVLSVLRAARRERKRDLFEGRDDADGDEIEAELEGEARVIEEEEEGVMVGEGATAWARLLTGSARDETSTVNSSISMVSAGQSL
jgi:hypothetical protein